ncbi:hypothetical protein FORC81_p433 (plasmid) [Escherichia coli]|nr:hypothetical protein FORC81_p433 [Escherichia coli]
MITNNAAISNMMRINIFFGAALPFTSIIPRFPASLFFHHLYFS